jgi:hypothetical protein
MKPRAARRRFFGLLQGSGTELELLTPVTALKFMTKFYKHDRFSNVDPSAGHDRLFCRWGPRHRERSDWFELSVGRQLTDGSKIGRSVRQLRVAFRYTFDGELQGLGDAIGFCRLPADADAFRRSLLTNGTFQMIAAHRHIHVEQFFGPV